MKRIISLLLILCYVLGMVGCSTNNTVPENTITAFYKREKPIYGADDGIIAAISLDTTNFTQEPAFLLNGYLSATPGEGFVSPFPKGVALIQFKLEGLTAKVVLNDRIADLSGMDLTIALTCLTETVMTLTGCHEVIISAATKQLDGQKFITLNRDSYLLLDDSGASQN